MPQTMPDIQETIPGVHHWTALRPALKQRVSSYYVEPAGVLIDPALPETGLEWFETCEVRPQQIVLTNVQHWRDSDRFVEAFDCLVRCLRRGLPLLEEAGRTAEPFNDADEVGPGVTAIEIGKIGPDETALHVACGEGAVAFGHALIRPGGGPLAFLPPEDMGAHPDRVRAGLRDALRGVLLRDFDALLFAHGEPLPSGGHDALAEFLARART
jgi:hypothetical protein